jgi:hypothetical protein
MEFYSGYISIGLGFQDTEKKIFFKIFFLLLQ